MICISVVSPLSGSILNSRWTGRALPFGRRTVPSSASMAPSTGRERHFSKVSMFVSGQEMPAGVPEAVGVAAAVAVVLALALAAADAAAASAAAFFLEEPLLAAAWPEEPPE